MSFFEKYLSKQLKDPEFKKEWDESELDYKLDCEIIQRTIDLNKESGNSEEV
jgi:hypothetical protein